MTKVDAPRSQAGTDDRAGSDSPGGDPGARRKTITRRILVTLVFVGLVLLMLRPGPTTLTRKLPNLGDPVLVAWSLAWSSHALVRQPLNLFDANIFWPHPLGLAYTDNFFVLLPGFALIRALGGSDPLAINLLMLAMLVICLGATYSLARWLTGRTDAAILAAIGYTFSSYTFTHLSQTDLLLLGLFPLGFLVTFRWLEGRRTVDAVLIGAVNVALFLGALYYAAIWVVCLASVLGLWLLVRRFRPGKGFWRGLLVAGAVSLLALPFVIPHSTLDQERPLISKWGLNPADLVIVAPGSILYGGLDSWANRRDSRGEHAFFPGFATLALAASGAGALAWGVVRRRRRRGAPEAKPVDGVIDSRRRFVYLLLAGGAAAAILALGPEVQGITMPFTKFHDRVPGFEGIRVAARLAVPALLVGCVLAAIGFSALTRRVSPRVAGTIAFVIGAFLLLELAAPLSWSELPTDAATTAVYESLSHKPDGAVAELPIVNPATDGPAAWAFVEAPRMLNSTKDWEPRVNGYSGGWPDSYLADADALNAFPSRTALDAARRLRVRYFVLHTGVSSGFQQYTPAQVREKLAHLPRGATVERHGNSWLIDLHNTKRGHPAS